MSWRTVVLLAVLLPYVPFFWDVVTRRRRFRRWAEKRRKR